MDMTPKDRARHASRRHYVRRHYAGILNGVPKSQHNQVIDEFIRHRFDDWKLWTYQFGTRREKFLLLRAALRVYARKMRAAGDHKAMRWAEQYAAQMVDVAPRRIVFTTREWRHISRALRPRGSTPAPGGREQQCYSIYQHMLRQKEEVE